MKFWYLVVGILWWVKKFLVKVLEFLSCVVVWVGLKIIKLVFVNVLIIFVISGVFGFIIVSLILLFWVKEIKLVILFILIVMFLSLGFVVVLVLLGVINIVEILEDCVVLNVSVCLWLLLLIISMFINCFVLSV